MVQLDETFFALSDPTRRAILRRLTRGEATVTELAAPFDISQPAISGHLKVLERAGLVTRRVDGTRRPCRLSRRGLDSVEDWLDAMHRALSHNYDRLDDLLAPAADPEPEDSDDE